MIEITKNEKEILLEALNLYYVTSLAGNITNKPTILQNQIKTLRSKIMIIGMEIDDE